MKVVTLFSLSFVLYVLTSAAWCAEMPMKKSKSSVTSTVKEYTFGLHTLNLGDEVRKGQNPFTGELMEFHIDAGMSKKELTSVKNILDEMRASRPDDDGYRHLSLPNRTQVGVGRLFADSSAGIQSLKVEFLVRGEFSTTEALLVMQLASAGNLFISSSVDPDLVATTRPVGDQRFHFRHKNSSVVSDADALACWINKNIESRDVLDTGGKTLGQAIDGLSEP